MLSDRELFEKTMELEKQQCEQWYHVIELPTKHGIVDTDGIYDINPIISKYGFPDMRGKRVLDVGCSDGFFSFKFEDMGAREVVGIDAYDNMHFRIAHEKKGSKVDYKIMDAYDINRDNLGIFDFVFCGTMLLHLENPIMVLRNIRSIINTGTFICANPTYKSWFENIYHLIGKKYVFAKLSKGRGRVGFVPTYWIPSEDCLREMIFKAGFDNIWKVSNFYLNGFSKAKNSCEHHYHTVFKMEVK